ncbi:putative acetylornithine aminotransferase precursor [Ramicandelaber brevisporus]|nr:putative acetylornithine aminotransferase precursor [Ramicandelaber brevisporus]
MTVAQLAHGAKVLERTTAATCSIRRLASTAAAASESPVSPSTSSVLKHADSQVSAAAREAIDRQSKYLINTYSRPPLMLVKGSGSRVTDADGRTFLDFTAGIAVNALGHADEGVTRVITEQASTLGHISNLYYNEWAGNLAEALVEVTNASGDAFVADKVFFSNSGTEANEGALKFARKFAKYTKPDAKDKYEVVCFTGAFHGRTMGALTATATPKYREPFEPLIPGFSRVNYNDIDAATAAITERTCAVILEPIQGEGGVSVATPEFLLALRQKCDEVGAVLIFDEIQCGLGRTGKLWGFQHAAEVNGVAPDIITSAKPLANGFPIGAIVTNKKVADVIKIGDHGTTFGGSPLACRVGHHVFSRISKPTFLEKVQETGAYLREGLERITAPYRENGLVLDVRGKGLILGVQFGKSPDRLVELARERGLLIITAGGNVVRFVPPLTLTKADIDEGLAILEKAFAVYASEA